MLDHWKSFFCHFLIGSNFLIASTEPFDSFHSNIGEILFLDPVENKKIELENFPQTNQANESVKKKPQISFSGKSISETDKQTKEQAGDLILSDEEIDNLLFEEIINWEEEDEGATPDVPPDDLPAASLGS